MSLNTVCNKKIKLKLKNYYLVNSIFYIKDCIYILNNKKLRIDVIKKIYKILLKDYIECFVIYKYIS